MNKVMPPDYNFFVQIVKLAKFLQPPVDKETGFVKERTGFNQVKMEIHINSSALAPSCHLTIRQFQNEVGKLNVPIGQMNPLPYKTWQDFFDQTEYLLYNEFKDKDVYITVVRDGDPPRPPRKEPVALYG